MQGTAPPPVSSGMGPKDFRSDINALRAFSVLVVVLYHFHVPGFGGGFLGVDVFFVISGFLMTRILLAQLEAGRVRYADFLLARVRRIVPALLVMIATLLAVGSLVLPPLDLRALALEAAYAAGFVSNQHYLAGQGYFRQYDAYRWLLHTWSLSVEWQFYLAYPFLFMLAAAVRRRGAAAGARTPRAVLLAFVVPLALGSFALNVALVRHGAESQAFYLLPARAWEMAAGGLVALRPPGMAPSGREGHRWALAGWALLFAALYLATRLSWQWQWPGHAAGLPVLGTLLVLHGGGTRDRLERCWLVDRLGRWSYAWYLWHWPATVALAYAYQGSRSGAVPALAAMAVSLAMAVLTHRLVEQPAQSAMPAARPRVHRRCGAAFAAVLAGVAVLEASDGLEARFGREREFYRSLRASVDARTAPEGCANAGATGDAIRLCPIEHGSRLRALVIGDSYGHQLYPWFERHFPLSVDFFVRAGCPVLRGFGRNDQWRDCADYAERAWDKAESPGYDIVVLAAKWGAASPAFRGPLGLCRLAGEDGCVPLDRLDDPQAAVESLRNSIEHLLALGKKVVFVDAHPQPGLNVPLVLSREMARRGHVDLGLDAGRGLEHSRAVDAMVHGLESRAGFAHVSFRDELCEAPHCPLYDAGLHTPVFRDDSHFDVTWLLAHGSQLRRWAEANRAP